MVEISNLPMDIQAEVRSRLDIGHRMMTLEQISSEIRKLGYRFDRSMDCRSRARYMSGVRAGESYPCLSLYPRQLDNGMSCYHYQARRDENYAKLNELRNSVFAVVRGHVAEW